MRARFVLAALAIVAVPVTAAIVVNGQSSGRPVTGECDPPAADGSTDCLIHIAGVEVPPSTVPDTSEPSTTTGATTTTSSTPASSTSTTTVPETDPPTTTTTEVPSTTSTSPPTTSAPSSTTSSTSSTTTTVPSPTTTAPPAGAAFSEDFSDPSSVSRFNLDVGNYVDASGRRTADYIAQGGDTPRWTMGDHDMGCGAPTTLRQIDNADRNNATLNSRYFWYCAPGSDPAKGHFMTGLDTTGYAVVSFSPKQTFTNVTKVCWDINATDEGGGKWTNMLIVPEALYQRHAPRMDYVKFDFNQPNAPGDFNLQAGDHPGMSFLGVSDHRGAQHIYDGATLLAHPGGDNVFVTADKAARYRHCFEKLPNGTTKLTVARPDGSTSVFTTGTATGAAWPSGPVRVIFQDEMYDPPKRPGYDPNHVTWHWDNITIS